MKNPFDVLRSKEQELIKVKREVEALRITVRLLDDNGSFSGSISSIGEPKIDVKQMIEMP